MQIPRGVHPQVPKESALPATQKGFGGAIFHERARQKECRIEESHLVGDHVYMLISIPPQYAVSQVVVYLKGKSAIQIARTYQGRKKNFTGCHFWARGYWVSTVGQDEASVRKYMPEQEKEDQRIDLSLSANRSIKTVPSRFTAHPPWAVHIFKPLAFPEFKDSTR